MMKLKNLKAKNILILGFGREGKDTFDFLMRLFPKAKIGIADKMSKSEFQQKFPDIFKNKGLNIHLGDGYLESSAGYDIIVKTPGISLALLKPYLAKKTQVASQTELFLENCPGRVVGVTGTKGKSTTSALIQAILKTGGKNTKLIGNIGIAPLSYLAKAKKSDIFVFEMSCHQLAELRTSPFAAVLLNIYLEHLDYYKNFSDYARAKANITKWQSEKDYLVFDPKNKPAKNISQKSRARKIEIDPETVQKTIDPKDIPLKGNFNMINVAAAIEIGKIFRIPQAKIAKAIKNFKPLEHRLEKIGTYKGITFYDDALSTIEQSTIAAIDALGNDVETLLLGGFDRGLTFKNLAKKILESPNIKNLILFPTTGEKIWEEIKNQISDDRVLPWKFFVDNMADAVKLSYEHTGKGKICLMSCASTSFSIFKDYREKGEQFKKYIEQFKK
ncbi:MAG: UDP-N-acetylmuramoyl-L-alanine--D-glutamate ligase [Candidatus Paceibacterota bacterium]|jgi:UDP-N-acetylmuramoylalanine--D-glutamate ligase